MATKATELAQFSRDIVYDEVNKTISGISASLADTAVTPGSYGSSTAIPVITVDAKGRITAASTIAIDGLPTQTGNSGKYLTTNGTSASWDTLTTDDVSEGSNLYYTDARARLSVSATDSGGDGSFSYNNSTGVFTYTGPSATEVRAHFSASTGITITNGAIATTITQYTDALARASVSVTDSGGDGSLSYDNTTGVFTYTGPSATEVRAHFSAGTGVSISSGQIAIGQAVATTSNVTFADINSTGNVQIDGNLTVSGTTVTVNATNLAVEDNMIYLNNGSTVAHPDLGIAGNYNDGVYKHAGFFRDATDGYWKVFKDYTLEPDASAFIDTTHASFALADIQAANFRGTLVGSISNALTIGTGLSGTSYNGSSAVTIAIDSTVATLTGTQTLTNKTLTDSTTYFQDDVTNSKKMQFQLSSISANFTRTLTVQDTDGTIALTGNKLSAFAATTSAELAGVISDETGSGLLVFATSPSFTTDIRTPKVTTSGATNLVLDTNTGTTTGSITIAAGANGNISLTPNGTGKVGIGTSNPSSNLHVEGSTNTYLRLRNSNVAKSLYLAAENDSRVGIYAQGDSGEATDFFIDNGPGEALTILANGNVGIGTTTPSGPIEINRTAASSVLIFKTAGSGVGNSLGFYRARGTIASPTVADAGAFIGTLDWNGYDGSSYINVGNLRVAHDGSTISTGILRTYLAYFNQDATGTLQERIRLDADGNFLVGTTSTQNLGHGGTNKIIDIYNSDTTVNSQSHIILLSNASAQADSSIGSISWGLPNASATNKGLGLIAMQTGSTSTSANPSGRMVFYTRNTTESTWAERARIDETGKLGVGTNNPNSKLHVYGDSITSQGLLKVESTASAITYAPAARFISARGNHSYGVVAEFSVSSASDTDRPSILFYGAQAAHSWQVGMGQNSTNNFHIGYRASNTPAAFSTWPTSYITIKTDGNVGIGTESPSVKLHVSGSSIIANNTAISPDSYTNLTIAGAISDGSWGVTSAVGGNAGTGDSWAIGHNGNYLYHAVGNGTSNGTLGSYMVTGGGNRHLWLVPSSGGNVSINIAEGTAPDSKLVINLGQSGLNQGIPASSGTTQPAGLRIKSAQGVYGETLDFGMNVATGASYGWIQATNYSGLNTNYTLALNPNGGNVVIGAKSTTNKFEVVGTSGQLFSVTDSMSGTIFAVNDVSGIPSIEVLDTGVIKLAQLGGFVAFGASANLTATGSTQAGALSLTRPINEVTSVPTGTGVLLPSATPGMRIIIRNSSANSLNVYPSTGAQINALGANTAYSLATGTILEFVSTSTTQWYTM